jgi:drug/metabolite transporter (DMT)-like permease
MLPPFSVLALASAALYGAADFIGGLTARRADTIAIVILSQAAGLLFIALLLPLLVAATPSRADLIWGGVAGVAGGVGVGLLYRALAIGVMAVVAPITAVCAVAVPVAIAVLLGERPGISASVGMAIAAVAIILVSHQPPVHQEHVPPGSRRSSIALALASGVAIGLFFLSLAQTDANAGLWPLLAARSVAVALFTGLALVYQRPLRMPRSVMWTAAMGGIVDMLANLLFLLASRQGPLTLVVTLSSLYPASTVVLARIVLGERLTRIQWVGVASALVAIVLIVRSTR